MNIRLRKIAPAILASIALASSAPAVGVESVKLSLEWLVSGRHVGFFVAQEKGYYREQGLDVTIERGYGSGDTVKRVATGSSDFGIADTTTLLSARANNDTPVMMVATFFNGGPEAILALKSSGINSAADLEGKRIGGGSTSASLKLLAVLAQKAGLKDYKTVPMASDQIYPALLSKQVDAITGFTDNAAVMAPQAAQRGDAITTIPYSQYGIDNYGSAIIVHADRVGKKDPAIAKFLEASLKGIAWSLQHPDDAVRILRKYAPLIDEEVAANTWKIDSQLFITPETRQYGLGSLHKERLQVTYDMARKYLGLEKEIKLEDAYSTEFLPKTPILP